jgi:hypothetical protein
LQDREIVGIHVEVSIEVSPLASSSWRTHSRTGLTADENLQILVINV